MIVKICGITNRDDAMAAAEAGASAIGFNFYRDSPRYVSPTGAAMIAGKLPPGLLKVGIFVNETAEAIAKVAIDTGIDVAQLYGISEATGMRVWRASKVSDELLPAYFSDDSVEAILLDSPSKRFYGGTGETFDWSCAKGLPKKTIIAGGLDETNVRQAILEAAPWGVDACSRIEESPGKKDIQKMRRFIEAALQS